MTNVDAVKEAADAKAWEELNKEDPNAKAAAELLVKAANALQQAEEFLNKAAAEVEDSPETYRIAALSEAVVGLEIDVLAQKRRM